MLEEELEEVLEIYDEIGAEISYRPVCLAEGNNKFFYQQIEELYSYDVQDGGNCIDIIKKLEEAGTKNTIGIIDGDYRLGENEFKNIVKIDYYSIENIALERIPDFKIIVKELQNKSDDPKIGIENLRSHDLKVKYFPKERDNLEFSIILCRQYNSPDRIEYVEDKIQELDSLIKYKNLKVVVDSTSKYLKMKLKIKIAYITDLHKYFENRSLKYILDSKEFQNFISIDNSINKQKREKRGSSSI